jgi:hypothetical protein
MSTIAECIKDVIRIANFPEDLSQTTTAFPESKKRIEQLFAESEAQHRGHAAVARRIRDQLCEVYFGQPMDAKDCIDRVISWLDEEHSARLPEACNILI